MIRDLILRILITCLIASSVGCHRKPWRDCSRIDISIAKTTVTVESTSTTGAVHSNFDAVANVHTIPSFDIEEFFSGETIALELEQCCCAAAINSPLADVIDLERKTICCSAGYNQCVDRFLAGQTLQQRNKSAGLAGELFLRLVEVHLQMQLIAESAEKIQELKSASYFAGEQGVVTADANEELDKQEIALNKKLVKLESSQTNLINKLNSVLGIDRCCSKTIEPIFELFPVFENIDNCCEFKNALNCRPDLITMKNGGDCIDPECYSILSQLDPRLGTGAVGVVRKCLLLQRLRNQPNPAAGTRNQQFEKLKALREELVRTEVSDAVLAIETGYRKLVVENQDLKRLQTRLETIEAAAELDAKNAFIQSIENWVEQQTVKSNRVSIAIEFEIAKVKLLEVTGKWTSICGLSGIEPVCAKNNCRCCN